MSLKFHIGWKLMGVRQHWTLGVGYHTHGWRWRCYRLGGRFCKLKTRRITDAR